MDLSNPFNNPIYWFELLCVGGVLLRIRQKHPFHWYLFAVYLLVIAVLDLVGYWVTISYKMNLFYYNLLVIPFEIMFFIGLYTLVFFNKPKWFIVCSVVYLSSYIFYAVASFDGSVFYTINYIMGNLIVACLVMYEYSVQLRSDQIIHFKQSMRFYVNFGVFIFYIGTLPYFGYHMVWSKMPHLKLFFIQLNDVFNAIMYLSFFVAITWSKPKSLSSP